MVHLRVYLANESALGDRLVVVKVAPWGGGEAETLGRLTHPNIVPVYSVQEDEESHLTAVCMPYLGHSTLLNVLNAVHARQHTSDRQTPRPTWTMPQKANLICEVSRRDAIEESMPASYTAPDAYLQRASYIDGIAHLGTQLAEALTHAHAAGICHRDLKPSNILLSPAGIPLLLDFNLSSDVRLDRTLVGGTLPYMPPEQLRSVVTEVLEEESLGDPRSDLFSLGVILYELLTGQLPFGDQLAGDEPASSAAKILKRQRQGCRPLSEINPHVDGELSRLVHDCLQLQPNDRPPTACQLAERLRQRTTCAARVRRWAQRRKFLLTATSAGMGIVAGSLGLGLATRPPLALRRYLAGVRAFKSNCFQEAADYFTEAHQARPQAYQPRYARAQMFALLGEYGKAGEDMFEVYKLKPEGLTATWAGYVFQLHKKTNPPLFYYAEAIDQYDYTTPAIWNNLARAYRTIHFEPNARDCLTRAIQLDPQCQVAYFNRASVYVECKEEFAADGTSYRQLAIKDIEKAVELSPYSGRAHFVAAKLHFLHDQSAEKDEQIMVHLRRAIDCGFDRDFIVHDSGFTDRYTAPLSDYRPQPAPQIEQQTLLAPPHVFPAWSC